MKLNLNTIDLTEDNTEEFFEEKPYGSRKDSEDWDNFKQKKKNTKKNNDNKRKILE